MEDKFRNAIKEELQQVIDMLSNEDFSVQHELPDSIAILNKVVDKIENYELNYE